MFASEMKAIFADGVKKEVSDKMVFYYLAYDVVENPNEKSETFYKNIKQLPPAHFLIINVSGDLKIKQYWDIDKNKTSQIKLEDAVGQFRELFDESVRIRLRSDVPVGSSFSGGIDSSSVVASIITQNPGIRLNTFTARFDDANYDEGNFIKFMSDKFDFNTNFCYPNEDLLLDELEKVFYPSGRTLRFNQHCCSMGGNEIGKGK